MINIKNYISLSQTAISIKETFTQSENFLNQYANIKDVEKESFLRHYIINNASFVFKTNPILFEQILQFLADRIGIHPSSIKLIGSAKTGFSISNPHFGKPFSKNSDLDFTIVDENVYQLLKEEFNFWAHQYTNNIINPRNEREKMYWDNNYYDVPKYQFQRGLIDTYKIPNWPMFPIAQNINSTLADIKFHLNDKFSIEVKGASARVYTSWNRFTEQLQYNTKTILNKVNKSPR